MTQGHSIHIGLNHLDSTHYRTKDGQPWEGKLQGCLNDANAMQTLAQSQGFTTQTLLDEQATAQAVSDAISAAAQRLKSGDLLFLTYSGHGSQVPDLNGDEEEDDEDETWCLFDREFVDDEQYALWSKFADGVRILVLSDSCHSGSVTKDLAYPDISAIMAAAGMAARLAPPDVQEGTYKAHQDLYDNIQKSLPTGESVHVGATVVLISGCQDNQVSADGLVNGLFTGTLLRTWNQGHFRGSLKRFHQAIVKMMPLYQVPNYIVVGADNAAFEKKHPFKI